MSDIISNKERAAIVEYIESIEYQLGCLKKMIGRTEEIIEKKSIDSNVVNDLYTFERKGYFGEIKYFANTNKCILLKGAKIAKETKASREELFSKSFNKNRNDLIESDSVSDNGDHFILNKDLDCSSPSYAGKIIIGSQSLDGRTSFKDQFGNTINDNFGGPTYSKQSKIIDKGV